MSGDQLNLDAIEANARHWDHLIRDDPDTTLALVAEVRRLRAIVGNSPSRGVSMPPPVIVSGKTPFDICTCLQCGPPWRDNDGTWPTEPFGRGTSWMALCPTCGNKRCPGANSHDRHPTP